MADIVTLDEVYALPDIATNNIWQLDFIKLPKTGVDITAKDINIRCQQFSMPSTSVQDLSVRLHNHVRHQSTITVQPTQITIPLLETKDMRSTKFCVAWREICSRTNDNYVSLQADREATIQFYMYSPQHDIIYTYLIEHVEFRNMGEITYGDGSSVAAVMRNVQLQVGRVTELT